jgi:MoaA/NifB/PqqE/SkfB family radical SAM enzyme
MYLDPLGDVRACCQNRWQLLGNVGERTLRDIWNGAEAAALREHLDRDDLSLGCELCQMELSMGAEQTVYLHQFDSLRREGPTPAWPRQLELALSIACNLQCVMCNGDLSSSIRIHRERRPALHSVYGDAFFEELDQFLPHLERITFLGGEPFLGPEPLRVMSRLIELGLAPACHVTTNGSVWNERVERFLTNLPVHVAVSVDGSTAATVEGIRIGLDFEAMQRSIERYRDAVAIGGGGLSLAFCMMRANWHELREVLAWGDRLDVDVYVNTVTHPPRLSFHHAERKLLEDVVNALEADAGAGGPGLGRNEAVWKEQLALLHGLLDRRRHVVADSVDQVSHARSIAETWSDGRGVSVVEVDASQVVTAILPEPGSVLGVDLRSSVGQSSSSVMGTVGPLLGTLVGSTAEVHADGVEERHFCYDGPAGSTDVAAVMAPVRAGERWFLSARRV